MAGQLIDADTRKYLSEKFEKELRDDVDLTLFVSEENREYADFARSLVEELHEIDERIKVTVLENGQAAKHGVESTPTILIGRELGFNIRYTGAPAGHEAGGFIETLTMVSRGESGLSAGSVEKLDKLDQDVAIKVFVTPTCPHCPRAAVLANQIAIASKGRVASETVEASQNMELAGRFNVSSVPQQVINDDLGSITIGAPQESAFVDRVLSYGASTYAEIRVAEEARRAEEEKLVDDPTAPLKVTDRNFQEAVAKYPNLVIDCWAEWCGPCRMVGPIIETLAQKHAGKVVFGKLDVDNNQAISGQYGIASIPTLLLFKNGKLVGTQVGALPEAALEAAIKKHGLL